MFKLGISPAWLIMVKATVGPLKGQKYAYIHHIGLVAMEFIWALQQTSGLNADLGIQCALLHDIIEDTTYDYAQLKDIFGLDVAVGVQALSKNKELKSKQAQMLDSLERIQQQPIEIWMVKLADRITNMSPPPFHWHAAKRSAYRDEAVLILKTLGTANEALAQRLTQRIEAQRLTQRIEAYGQYTLIQR